MVLISSEDLELIDLGAWRVWVLDGAPRAVCDKAAKRKRYRHHLHREVAFRMRPDLIKRADCMRVVAVNGNYLDVRRENLEIVVKPRPRRGPAPRPKGHATGVFRATKPSRKPPAWSRDAN